MADPRLPAAKASPNYPAGAEYLEIWRGVGILRTRLVNLRCGECREARFLVWNPNIKSYIGVRTWRAHTEAVRKELEEKAA